MRYVTVDDVLEVHRQMIDAIGGSHGIRDSGAIESSVAQPQMSFAGEELYPHLADKATALCFSLVKNHPFVDGNKRVGHAAMTLFLRYNRYDLSGSDEEHEQIILSLAAGRLEREELLSWVEAHIVER